MDVSFLKSFSGGFKLFTTIKAEEFAFKFQAAQRLVLDEVSQEIGDLSHCSRMDFFDQLGHLIVGTIR